MSHMTLCPNTRTACSIFCSKTPALSHTRPSMSRKSDFCLNPRQEKRATGRPASSRRRKRVDDESNETVEETPVLSETWYLAHSPMTVKDLAVQPLKQQEVRDWFSRLFQDSELDEAFAEPGHSVSRIALIQGPSGSGKTTAVRLIAQSLDIRIVEYVPLDNSEHELHVDLDDTETHTHSSEFGPSHTSKFNSFLRDCNRYDDPESETDIRKVALVEDLPHVFVRNPNAFHTVMRQLVDFYPKHMPIVFMWTTTLNSTESFRIFPVDFCETLHVKTITFNPVTRPLLKKALSRVKGAIPIHELETIVTSSAGDLRSAFNQLEMRFSHNDALNHGAENGVKNNKRAKYEAGDTILSQRQLFNSTFHYFGKILYPKRLVTDSVPSDTRALRQLPLVTSPDVLVREQPCSSMTLMLKLHQNYVKRVRSLADFVHVSDMMSVAEMVSRSDYMEQKPHFEEYQADLIVRSVMYSMPPKLMDSSGKDVQTNGPTAGLVLQESLRFYDYDRFCRGLKLMSLNSGAADGRYSDLFSDFVPFVRYLPHSQRQKEPHLNVIISEIDRMCDGNRSGMQYDDDAEERDSGASPVIKSNFVSRATRDKTRKVHDEEERSVTLLKDRLKGLGVDEDPNDYRID